MNGQSIRRQAARILRKVIPRFLPVRRVLPFHYWLHQMEGSVENELRCLQRICLDRTVAIDVGANEGLFAYKMSQLFSQVYAFEINDELTTHLAAYNPGNIEILHQGLSSQPGTAVLFIPVLDGFPLTGWASLSPGNCPGVGEHMEKRVSLRTLDSFDIDAVSLIKIDVEGHEVEVLRGAKQTLLRSRPCVLVEVKPHNEHEVVSFFSQLNYERRELRDLAGVDGSEENCLFMPARRP
jgi:FkbM family methyltransferase